MTYFDNTQIPQMHTLGLIGKNISYSFSKAYFSRQFERDNLPFNYENFDLQHISELKQLLASNKSIIGFNVTIPYKEEIIPLLDNLHEEAKQIGAVNTITVSKTGKLKGYNTDFYGFEKSIKPLLKLHHKTALILGTGGASKAITYALQRLGISFDYVSRTVKHNAKFTYSLLTPEILKKYTIIINCTPLGTHPNIDRCPNIPYEGITDRHLLYDLVYNPDETKFLKLGKNNGAQICNGYKMLEFQADKAWEIWNTTF